MYNQIEEIRQGNETAFINSSTSSNLAYRPEFISNNYKEGRKVLSSIENELLNCDSFSISVAFITMSGIIPFLLTLEELEKKGIKGRILTTNYLNFTEPKALETLNKLTNIEVKMYEISKNNGFHTKGYIFKEEEVYRIIVGSSNMTQNALTTNKEWNTKVVSTTQGEYAEHIIREFDDLWNSKSSKKLDEILESYRINYEIVKKQKQIAKQENIVDLNQYKLKPNSMQIAFVEQIKKLINSGENRGLLISATGTGKTYASAFAIREMNPKRMLFIVHREQIAKQAIRSYKKVFGNTKTLGLLSGNSKEYHTDFVFATMQTISKEEVLSSFLDSSFDVIVLDEAHHVGNASYQKIMNYFNPIFWLGMTASPDTNDYDIYAIFHHNIAYEIRLQQALEEDLLCPFHYFGITDIELDGTVFNENDGMKNFANLVSEKRVEHILEKATYYGYSGDRVKGVIFCSRKDEARELSTLFNKKGYKTSFLCGEDSQEKRELCISQLTTDNVCEIEDGKYLDYIFTVDIFNEGIDIVEINQVIMLRPTESPIIFIQQLGRGLRKSEGKEFVVVLDFIGNYMNNFMIPMALSGDRTYNKDTIRRYMMEGSRIMPGASSIHFDEISKQKIFSSIDKISMTKKLLTEKYQQLKYKLGRIPTMVDFYQYGEIDPMLFVNYAKTYHRFLQLVDADYTIKFTNEEENILEFVSSIILNGKRPHEILVLLELLKEENVQIESIICELKKYQIKNITKPMESALKVLNMEFINSQTEKKKYATVEFLDKESLQCNQIKRGIEFYKKLKNNAFRVELQNCLTYALKKYEECYQNHDEDGLVLYEKYSRKDVCRILNWEKDDSSTIYGYRIKYNTCPIFVTYEKKDEIASSTKYEDQFINEEVFSWMTRSRVALNSAETQQIIHYKENNLKLYLFIKKSDGEGSDFYYMGKITPFEWKQTSIKNDKNEDLAIMNFKMHLEHSVRSDIYDYFTK